MNVSKPLFRQKIPEEMFVINLVYFANLIEVLYFRNLFSRSKCDRRALQKSPNNFCFVLQMHPEEELWMK